MSGGMTFGHQDYNGSASSRRIILQKLDQCLEF